MQKFSARIANGSKPQPHFGVSTGRRSHRARSRPADAGSGGRPLASAAVAIGASPLGRPGGRAAATGWRGECQPGPARKSVAAVCPGRRRRGAEARSRRRTWQRRGCGSRAVGDRDPACDGGDVFGRQPLDGARTGRAMSENPFSLWVYLSQSPLLWLTVTLLIYAIADAVSLATHRKHTANQ